MTDRVDDLRDDILAGPDELARVLDAHARTVGAIDDEAFERPRWRFLGMGSSRFAALDAAARLRAEGRDAVAELAAGGDPTPAGHDVVAVVISSSGRTPEALEAADRHRGPSLVIGLTSDPDSPLAGRVDALVPLVVERHEASGIATLSYRSTVAALSMLVDRALGRPPGVGLPAAVPALEALLEGRDAWLTRAADALDGGRPVHVLGAGSSAGTAEQAALMLREGPRVPAVAFDTTDWLHVGLYPILPRDGVLLLAGSMYDEAAAAVAKARGAVVVTVGGPADDRPADVGESADVAIPLPSAALDDPSVRALVEPAVADLLAAELWRRTEARDVTPRDDETPPVPLGPGRG